MGVYIPNMEKPKDCDLCPFADLFGICKDDCPLIEIPASHGSLKEELEKKLYEYIDPFEVPGALEAFYDAMDRFTKGE